MNIFIYFLMNFIFFCLLVSILNSNLFSDLSRCYGYDIKHNNKYYLIDLASTDKLQIQNLKSINNSDISKLSNLQSNVTSHIPVVKKLYGREYANVSQNNQGHNFNNLTMLISKKINQVNNLSYNFSQNKNEIKIIQNVSNVGKFDNLKLAFVKPTFTDAAYANKFYVFYSKYSKVPKNVNVTTDLDLLTSHLSAKKEGTIYDVFAMLDLVRYMNWIANNKSVSIISDQDVDAGDIFTKNNNAYNVLILGHQEYVTQSEYNNLEKFVSNGGTIIILDGNVFYAEVKYNKKLNSIVLVKGHGWAFNGKSAWKSVSERWENETSQWVGSNYLCYQCSVTFKNNPFNYTHHEEQYLTNPKDIILLDYNATNLNYKPIPNIVVATYELKYGKGKVISLGIYSDDIINQDSFDRYFDNLFVKYVLTNII